eukprot:augustus_masked-scaffold_33-processed-gene-2.17-mRNA-1 protein AED:1.00 eAED:1.00 QI:0/-1/0/0/-1/1/1/0/443
MKKSDAGKDSRFQIESDDEGFVAEEPVVDKYGRSIDLSKLARGDIEDKVSVSSLDSDEEEDNEEIILEDKRERNEESSKYIAIENLDWKNIKAVDLFVALQSFSQNLISIKIYQSEFGEEKSKEEENSVPKFDENLSKEKQLLKYERDLLRYFFAVCEFSTVLSAEKVYAECDEMEFGSSSIVLDMSFIPENVLSQIKNRPIRDSFPLKENSTVDDVLKDYVAPKFVVKALQNTSFESTWDNEDRKVLVDWKKGGENVENEIKDEELERFLASDSESEDEDAVKRTRTLLLGGDEDELSAEDSEDDLKYLEAQFAEFEKRKEKIKVEELENFRDPFFAKDVKEKKEEKEIKVKEDENLELLMMDEKGESESEGEEEKKKKKKRKSKKSKKKAKETSINVADSRFKEVFDDVDFGLDQTSKFFKKGDEGMKHLQKEVVKRRKIS